MGVSKNEIIEAFARELKALDKQSDFWAKKERELAQEEGEDQGPEIDEGGFWARKERELAQEEEADNWFNREVDVARQETAPSPAEETRKPQPMTPEQYDELSKGNVTMSGESEWSPKSPEAPAPEEPGVPVQSGETEWSPTPAGPLQPEWVEKWKSHVKPGDTESGKTEWYNPDVEYNFEEEMVERHDSDIPEDAGPGYRYHPEEKVYRGPWHPERRPEHLKKQDEEKLKSLEGPKESEPEYSDEEYFKMVEEEPEHVVTNLMLQRKAPYNQFKYIYPLAKSTVDWLNAVDYTPEKGSMLYEEIVYMLDMIEQEAERKEREEAGKAPSGETE